MRGRCKITIGGVGGPTPLSIMKILSWNGRGIGNPRVIQDFLKFHHVENLHLVFIMETRLKINEKRDVVMTEA